MSVLSETATLAHGYTMADLESIARHATRIRANRMIDPEEALAVAWHGAVVALYKAEVEPARHDLVEAGLEALSFELGRLRSHYGMQYANGERLQFGGGANFKKYWAARPDTDDRFTERIAERLALPAVLSVLTSRQYEAIATLAAFDNDMHAAAEADGSTYQAFRKNVLQARRRLQAVWFEHETPRRMSGTDEKCRNGHSRSEHGYRNPAGKLVCGVCLKSGNRRSVRRWQERQKDIAAGAL